MPARGGAKEFAMSKKIIELKTRRAGRTRFQLKRKSKGRIRLSVFRSSKHIYAQIIDDAKGQTLAAASSLDEGIKGSVKTGADIAAAKAVGKLIAERAKEKKIEAVVFDRGRFLYHGRIKALADAAREAGLSF
jgi:large subunit ribosomal protein L18